MYLNDKGLNSAEEYMEHRRRLKEDPQYRKQWEDEREQERQAYWTGLKLFVTASDVPTLPNLLTPFYIKQLRRLGAIPFANLQHNQWYYGDYLNSELGRWDAVDQVFHHLRYKWGYQWDTCKHYEQDNGFALFTPIRLATPQEIEAEVELAPTDI